MSKTNRTTSESACPTPANHNSEKNSNLKQSRGLLDDTVFTEPATPSSVRKLRTSKLASDVITPAKFKEIENQCRRLVVERSLLLKNVACKDEDLKKLTFKQQSLMKIKTNLQSTIAGHEKELKELRKSNDILKAKNGILENTGMKKNKIHVDLANARGLLVAKEHDIADLKSEISNLKAELKEKQNGAQKMENLFEEMKTLQANITMIEKENSVLKQCGSEHGEEHAAAAEELVNLKLHQEQLLIERDLKSQRILELQSEFYNTQERYASSLECSESLQSYKDTLNDRVSLLKGHNYELENQCDSYLKTISSLEHQVGVICQEKKSNEDMLYDALKDADSLRQELTSWKEFEYKMNADKQQLESDLDDLTKKIKEVRSEMCEKQVCHQKEIASLREKNEENIERHRKKIEWLHLKQNEIEKERDDLQKRNEELESLNVSLVEAKKEFESLQTTIEENIKHHQEEVESLRAKQNEIENELRNEEKINEDISLEKDILGKKIEQLIAVNNSLEAANSAKCEKIEEKENLISELKRANADSEQFLRDKDIELDDRNCELKKSQQCIEDYKWQLQEANENCVNLEDKFGDLESLFTVRENEVNILNTKNGELFKLLKDKDEMINDIYGKMRKVEDELVEKHLMFESISTKTRELEDSLAAQITANNKKDELFNGVSEEKNILVGNLQEMKEKLLVKENEIENTNEKMDVLTKDNCLLEEEITQLKNVIGDNEQRINQLTKHSHDVLNVQQDLTCRVLDLESRLVQKENAICELEKEKQEAETLSEEMVVRCQQLEKRLMEKEEKLHEMFKFKNELDNIMESCTHQQKCIVEQRREISEIRDSNVWMRNELDKYKANLEWYEDRKNGWLQEISSSEERFRTENEEKTKWKKMFIDLKSKVEPFQAQLDMFEAEKNALLSDNSDAHNEVAKMSKQYAALLGHQNQKQKIHHVIKLKEENLNMKKEVSKFREQNLKLQKKIDRFESQLNIGKRRFDPSKAFAHSEKENYPLHDSNV
uniref:Hyaluronan-mediated motility receptor C-terminal domain-containing protein n=1 Tax=Strigamia maritima TaxID=126957 RepID=T1IPJ7_STRMM